MSRSLSRCSCGRARRAEAFAAAEANDWDAELTPIVQTMAESERKTAHEIFEAAISAAKDELARPSSALAISGLAGGVTMGLTGMAVAVARAHLGAGEWQQLASMLLYPIGFISVIIGRAQLFTENTLWAVFLVSR